MPSPTKGLMAGLEQFLTSGRQNSHIDAGDFNAYVRRAQRILPGDNDFSTTLDIGSLSRNPDRPAANLSQLLELLRETEAASKRHGLDALYAENTLNHKLPKVLPRLGFTREDNPNYSRLDVPSFYKRLK